MPMVGVVVVFVFVAGLGESRRRVRRGFDGGGRRGRVVGRGRRHLAFVAFAFGAESGARHEQDHRNERRQRPPPCSGDRGGGGGVSRHRQSGEQVLVASRHSSGFCDAG
jgi:hypothetical protein